MDFLKNAIGVGELALDRDLIDEAEFGAGMSGSPHAACGSDQSTIRRSDGSCQHDRGLISAYATGRLCYLKNRTMGTILAPSIAQ